MVSAEVLKTKPKYNDFGLYTVANQKGIHVADARRLKENWRMQAKLKYRLLIGWENEVTFYDL